MRGTRGGAVAIAVAVMVGGMAASCSSSSKSGTQGGEATATGQVSVTQTQAPSPSPTVVTPPSQTVAAASTSAPPAVAGGSASAQGVTTSIDPCQVVTQAEASAIAGTSFGAGQAETAGLSKRCTYGAQTLNVFTVEAAQATDAAAAQAAWNDAAAEVNATLHQKLPPGVTLAVANTNVSGIGDKAALISGTATIQGRTFGISGIYVLKGAKFFAFQDFLLGTPPSGGVMEAQAQKALGRI